MCSSDLQADLQVVKHGVTLSTPFSATFESPNLIRVTSECVRKVGNRSSNLQLPLISALLSFSGSYLE